MCLTIVTKEHQPPVPVVKGYKVFAVHDDGLRGEYRTATRNYGTYCIGKWYHAKANSVFTPTGQWYDTGFHFFHRIEDAVDWLDKRAAFVFYCAANNRIRSERAIFKIEARNVTYTGKQDGAKVSVAQKIRILERVNRKEVKK